MKLQYPTNSVTLVLVALALVIPVQAAGMLYAPSWNDNPTVRAQLSELIGGPVHYWNAYTQGTPPVDIMLGYDAVFTWCNYPYADPVAMGDNLADYVDQGGRAILGLWCYPGDQGNYLEGRIMTAEYCPAVIGAGGGAYNHDGTDCVHDGVTDYMAFEVVLALQPGAHSDGTVGSEGKSAVAWRADRRVCYSGGNAGFEFTAGDWVQLTANMVLCPASPALGDLNCDGDVNGYDIDPFVLALTDPSAYDEQLADCDYMLADCNQDGAVNGYDIDPFVELLTSR